LRGWLAAGGVRQQKWPLWYAIMLEKVKGWQGEIGFKKNRLKERKKGSMRYEGIVEWRRRKALENSDNPKEGLICEVNIYGVKRREHESTQSTRGTGNGNLGKKQTVRGRSNQRIRKRTTMGGAKYLGRAGEQR